MPGARLAVVALLLTLSACGLTKEPEPPSFQQWLAKSHVYGQEHIRIGVRTDQPLMAERDSGGEYRGFDIEIARIIAAGLGFTDPADIEFVPVADDDRVAKLRSGAVDLVVAGFSITDQHRAEVRFAGPYYVTTQEALVPVAKRAELNTIADLKRHRVCTAGGATSDENLRDLGLKPQTEPTERDCVDGILAGRYDAVSADSTVLAGFQYQHPDRLAVVNLPVSGTGQLGIGVPPQDEWLEGLVGHILLRNYERGRTSDWQAAYDRTLGRALGPATQPPPLAVPELVDDIAG